MPLQLAESPHNMKTQGSSPGLICMFFLSWTCDLPRVLPRLSPALIRNELLAGWSNGWMHGPTTILNPQMSPPTTSTESDIGLKCKWASIIPQFTDLRKMLLVVTETHHIDSSILSHHMINRLLPSLMHLTLGNLCYSGHATNKKKITRGTPKTPTCAH